MKRWQQWLGNRIAELKSTNPDTTYERIGQQIREQLRNQKSLDPTESVVLSKLESKIPGKLGPFIGNVYRTYMETESE
jgi:hypothetical protein